MHDAYDYVWNKLDEIAEYWRALAEQDSDPRHADVAAYVDRLAEGAWANAPHADKLSEVLDEINEIRSARRREAILTKVSELEDEYLAQVGVTEFPETFDAVCAVLAGYYSDTLAATEKREAA